MWLQFDWGEGPRIGARRTNLFCAWLAWSRFRVVLPTWDRTLGTLVACLDATLRRVGGAPTYLLTDNEKTVTVEHVAGVAVRHPEMVAAGRHYGCKVETCVPYDPESKGGAEATVKVAKRDLVPTSANLLEDYPGFAAFAAACTAFEERVNARVHRETGRAPGDMLAEERARLHVLPVEAHTAALGETRTVNDDQTIRWGSVRYSRTGTRAGRCGAVSSVTNWSLWPAPSAGWVRSPGMPCPRRGGRGSWTSTTRTTPPATVHGRRRRRPAPPPRSRSWPSARAPRRG